MLTDAAGVRLLVDMTVAAMLSISLLARWLTKIASFLDFACYSGRARLLQSICSRLGVAYAGINKQSTEAERLCRESTRHASTAWIHLVRELSDGWGTC